jgi:hypothetical protein
MDDPPFSVSPEAAALIEERLRFGDTFPELAGQRPTLSPGTNWTFTDPDGRVVEHFADESWNVGYDPPEQIAASGFVPVAIGGRTLWFHPEALRDLTGKQLVVETVDVGVPVSASRQSRLIRAV